MKILFAIAMSAQASRVVESSSSFRAKMWLKTHDPSGDQAGMDDLKNSDPNAFAIVQALLTKKSLGLLDPSHPTAGFGNAAPKQHKSFQQEADEAGLTQDTPSAAVSEMEMHSSMPYPSPASDSSPYPEVHASHDPWNYKKTHSDDDIVNSVLGGEAAAPAQPETDTLSLSAVSAQEQQSMPAPVEHREAAPAPVQNAAFSGMPSLSWGNPMAGSSAEESPAASAAPVAQAAQADTSDDHDDQMLSLSAVRNQEESKMGITESVDRMAPAPVVYAQPAPVAYAQPAPVAALASVAAPIVQPAPVSIDSYVAANPAPTVEESPKRLEMSSFHSHMGYRMNMHADDSTPTSDNILSLRKQNYGNSYDSFLKQARTNRWKRAMDVTMNMKPPGGGAVNNAYLMDLS